MSDENPTIDIITPSRFLFDAISTNLFVCLCILAIEIIVSHIAMVVCMIKYRLYRRRYQSLRDLKKFKEFVTKEIPIPAEMMDREMQTDESCFDDNGYLPIVGKSPEQEETEGQSKLISHHDSMPPLEHHESYMTSEANEQPPNYDEECLQVYPEDEFELREKKIDFSKDRSPAAREEIATRCGAEKIFVPNRWGGKTSILNLYVTGILPSPYLKKLHFNEIGLEDVMQVCIRYLNGDDPVGGIFNIETRKTFTISSAHDENLISKKQAIMMLEAQACTGAMINPSNGDRLRVEKAVEAGFVAAAFKKHLLLAEQSVFGFETSTGSLLPLFEAMKMGLIPQGMAYRIMEVQFVTGGLICPRRCHRVPTNIALESGLIDQNTLGVLQKRAQNDSYRQLYDSAQDDPSSGFRLLYVDPNAAKPKEEKKIDPKMFDAVPTTKKMTLDRMAKTGMINQQLLKDFQAGKVNETQVKEKLLPFIGGSSAIGGIIHMTNGQIYSFAEAAELRLVKKSIAIEMLQAQVATGGVLNPKNGQICELRNAIETNLVPNEFEMHLQEAEKAFKGFVMAGYSGPVPLVEAIRVGIVAEMQGTRLLDAQCNTGGLVDPAFGYRVPLEVARDKGLIDPRVTALLNPETSEQKAYTDPNTGKNCTYDEMIQKCTKRNNVLLLPIDDRIPQIQTHQMIFN